MYKSSVVHYTTPDKTLTYILISQYRLQRFHTKARDKGSGSACACSIHADSASVVDAYGLEIVLSEEFEALSVRRGGYGWAHACIWKMFVEQLRWNGKVGGCKDICRFAMGRQEGGSLQA